MFPSCHVFAIWFELVKGTVILHESACDMRGIERVALGCSVQAAYACTWFKYFWVFTHSAIHLIHFPLLNNVCVMSENVKYPWLLKVWLMCATVREVMRLITPLNKSSNEMTQVVAIQFHLFLPWKVSIARRCLAISRTWPPFAHLTFHGLRNLE